MDEHVGQIGEYESWEQVTGEVDKAQAHNECLNSRYGCCAEVLGSQSEHANDQHIQVDEESCEPDELVAQKEKGYS